MNDTAIWALAVAVAAHAVTWLFRTPKEATADIERRMTSLEDDMQALTTNVATLTERTVSMSNTINDLSGRISKLTDLIITQRQANGRVR